MKHPTVGWLNLAAHPPRRRVLLSLGSLVFYVLVFFPLHALVSRSVIAQIALAFGAWAGLAAGLAANSSHIQSIIRDISDRKRTEMTLREGQERLRTLIEHIPIGVWAKDTSGRYITQNRASRSAAQTKRHEYTRRHSCSRARLRRSSG